VHVLLVCCIWSVYTASACMSAACASLHKYDTASRCCSGLITVRHCRSITAIYAYMYAYMLNATAALLQCGTALAATHLCVCMCILPHTTVASGATTTGTAEPLTDANSSSAARAAAPLLKAAHVGAAIAPVGMQLSHKPLHSTNKDRFTAFGVPSAD
jgi:hypothetical protein